VDEWAKRERHPSRAEFAVVIRGGHQGFIETSVAAIKSSLLLGSTPAAIVQTLLLYNQRAVFRSLRRYSPFIASRRRSSDGGNPQCHQSRSRLRLAS
jgi:hypothetical protein